MIFDVMFSSVVEEMYCSMKDRICIAGELLVLWTSVPSWRRLKSLIYNGFGFFHLCCFYLLDIFWTLFSEKQTFSPCFKRFCEQKKGITQGSFHCPVMSLFNFKNLCDWKWLCLINWNFPIRKHRYYIFSARKKCR